MLAVDSALSLYHIVVLNNLYSMVTDSIDWAMEHMSVRQFIRVYYNYTTVAIYWCHHYE